MSDDDEHALSRRERLLSRSGWLIGLAALIAWLAMLWLMFGDVL